MMPAPYRTLTLLISALLCHAERLYAQDTQAITMYPKIDNRSGTSHYDPDLNIMTNVVGARSMLVGTAARDGVQWTNSYLPGVDSAGAVQFYAIATQGAYAGVFATRSSDNPRQSPQNVIGSINLVVADSKGQPHLHWASYDQGVITAESAFTHLINVENSIQNLSPHSPSVDPFNINPVHLSNNLRLDCGVGSGTAHTCSAALSIVPNGAAYHTGILFAEDALIVDGSEDPSMIAAGPSQALTWYGSKGHPVWQIVSHAKAGQLSRLMFDKESMMLTIGGTTTLTADSQGLTARSLQAGGPTPVIGGTCPTRELVGGANAGAMHFSANCAQGTIILRMESRTAHGWACYIQDLTNENATFRQIDYGRATATIKLANVKKGDQATYLCTGF
jgi:hypothetical protein